ncbi:hypothetical protein SAMD00024442_45_4 [Candidatus Symbiothrix dinenymphae]|nr:hypothetical protein SAMD00024442_45_4 [Candidatus Symbiothrix dinenymphae]
MKKSFILVGIVAALCSCNDDMYDNIKEMVDKEIVYPAGYDDTLYFKAAGGYHRVEIDLYRSRLSAAEMEKLLPKAKKTVVEYGDTLVRIDSLCSWVDITNLYIPQTYRFKIYTEDKYGNKSIPVEITGKPFTDAEKDALLIGGISYTANTTQAAVSWTTMPDAYTVIGAEYSYTDPVAGPQSMNTQENRIVLNDLPVGGTIPVDISFKVVPTGAIDPVVLSGYNISITTMTAGELYAYIHSGTPFPAIVEAYTGNPYYIYNSTPFVLSGGAFDLGGEGVGYHKSNRWGGNYQNYRTLGGDVYPDYGIDWTSLTNAGVVGVGWVSIGDWYAYTVEVVDPGVYKLEYCHKTPSAGTQASLSLDALDVFGLIPMLPIGGAYAWYDPDLSIRLSTGVHKLRWTLRTLAHDFGGLRLTWVSD